MNQEREVWVDYIKVIACILVVLGHFFQSMVKAHIIPETSLHIWFNTTIYYFHVPLFFICSGYLYQKYSRVYTLQSWKHNILKKLVNLGIPFFLFSSVTWILKYYFSDKVSNPIGTLGEVLFISPYPPYWYLYVLFFIFLIIPTVKKKNSLVRLTVLAAILKVATCLCPEFVLWKIYPFYSVASYLIWFVLGIDLSVVGAVKIKNRALGIMLFFLFLSISIFTVNLTNSFIVVGMTTLACISVFMIMSLTSRNKVFEMLAPYTMPVFLMHTLTAAPIRIFLVRNGINDPLVHIIVGLLACIIGPVIVVRILEMIKLDFLVYPGKYIKIKM